MQNSVAIVILDESRQKVVTFLRGDVSVWVLPGGAIDPGETPEEAAVREAKEETGLDVEIVRKVGEYEAKRLAKGITHLFEARATSGSLQDSPESIGVDYYQINSLPQLFFPIHETWIKETLERSPLICRELHELTYGAFLKFLLFHPIRVLHFLFAKWVRARF